MAVLDVIVICRLSEDSGSTRCNSNIYRLNEDI